MDPAHPLLSPIKTSPSESYVTRYPLPILGQLGNRLGNLPGNRGKLTGNFDGDQLPPTLELVLRLPDYLVIQ